MSVATVYARVLLEASPTTAGPGKIELELDSFLLALKSNKDLHTVLCGPIATAAEKSGIIKEISKALQVSDFAQRFLSLLVKKNRLTNLSDIMRTYRALRFEAAGGVVGNVVSAEAFLPADMQTLTESFEKKLGSKVLFHSEVDPELLAGMRVTVRGVTYDGSLKSQLTRLRDQVLTRE